MKRRVMSFPMYNGHISGEYMAGEFEADTVEKIFQKARENAIGFFGNVKYYQMVVQTKVR